VKLWANDSEDSRRSDGPNSENKVIILICQRPIQVGLSLIAAGFLQYNKDLNNVQIDRDPDMNKLQPSFAVAQELTNFNFNHTRRALFANTLSRKRR